ncbi:MAG: MerR family transcriptional regulator [Salinicola sp.]|uniref:chaperone modulator CbpM n=1 Tax=Salinicola sp. TaxID=1978524 RepID=UPI000C8ACB91|nr:chaperone modulator CbpM [Salinicola sp.]MAM56690.1 MerR family transcriptional regulator [Salinicola sp.]NRB56189.1 MerR family transcriptional regulator [Salinicola sp.]
MTIHDLTRVPVDNLDETPVLTLGELCRTCTVHAEWVIELVDEGVIVPHGRRREQWRFYGASLHRVRVVQRLQRDLGVNLAGAALALELMDEVARLRRRAGE